MEKQLQSKIVELRDKEVVTIEMQQLCAKMEKQLVQQVRGNGITNTMKRIGGVVASWLVHLLCLWIKWPGFEAWPGTLCCFSWERHFTLVVPLSTQVYKWAPANLLLGVTL